MKRRIVSLGALVLSFLLVQLPAFAQTQIQQPPQVGGEVVKEAPPAGAAEAGGGGVAFTGAELTVLIAVLVGLVLLGTLLVIAGRRRAARAAA